MNPYPSSRSEQVLAQELKRLLQDSVGQQTSSALRTCLPQLVHLLLCEQGRPMHQVSQRVHQILADRCQAVTDWDIAPVEPDKLGEIVRLTVDALAELRARLEADPPPRPATEPQAPASWADQRIYDDAIHAG